MYKSKFLKLVLLVVMVMSMSAVIVACNHNELKSSVIFMDENSELKRGTAKDISSFVPAARDDAEFGGWFVDKSLTTPYDPQQHTGDLTLYAKWNIKTFTVRFLDINNETIKVNGKDTQTVLYGQAATAPEAPQVQGYSFLSWNMSFASVNKNITVKAVYTANVHKLSFVVNGAEIISENKAFSATLNTAVNAAEMLVYDYIPAGLDFDGWDIDGLAGADEIMPDNDVTYTAKLKVAAIADLALSSDLNLNSGEYGENLKVTLSAVFKKFDNVSYTVKWFTDSALTQNAGEGDSLTLTGLDVGAHTYFAQVVALFNGAQSAAASTSITITINGKSIEGVTVSGVNTEYSASAHYVTVNGAAEGDKIYYSVDGGAYQAEAPVFTEVCQKSVKVKIVRKNYNDKIFDIAVIITKAALTVKVDAVNVIYGETPQFTAEISGFKGADDKSVLDGGLTFVTPYTGGAGTYELTAEGLKSSNYEITYIAAILTVSKKSVTITANDTQVTYGDAIPAFSAVAEGLINGDVLESLGRLTFSTNYTQGSPVISDGYFIEVRGLMSNNYKFDYIKGNLSVLKKAVAITAVDTKTAYGHSAPAFSVTADGLVLDDGIDELTGISFSCNYEAASAQAGEQFDIIPFGAQNANYEITYISGTLTITKQVVEIIADSLSITYGDDTPRLTAKIKGLVNGDTADDLSIELKSDYAAGANAGEYAIILNADNLNANYTAVYTGAALTVAKKAVSVYADNKQTVYGDDAPDFTITAEGLVLNEGIEALGEIYSACDYDKATASAGDIFEITLSGGQNNNYDIAFISGKLTVTKRPVTVKADSKEVIYGDGVPALSASAVNLANGDAVSDLNVSISTSYTKGADSGEYEIVVSALNANTNYSYSVVNGKLTVLPKEIEFIADAKTVIYGQNAPAFTFSYMGLAEGDSISDFTAAVFQTQYKTGAATGEYSIAIIGGLTNKNYTSKYTSGTLNVEKRNLTITLNIKQAVKQDEQWQYSDWTGALSGLYSEDAFSGELTVAVNSFGIFTAIGESVSPFAFNSVTVTRDGSSVLENYNLSFNLSVELILNEFNYNARGVAVSYDKQPHSVTVETELENAEILFSTNGTDYTAEKPSFTDAGDYNVYYRINDTSNLFDSVEGVLTVSITKVDVTVKADDVSVTYGGEIPVFTATAVGLAVGDVLENFGELTFTTQYRKGLPVVAGGYSVEVGGIASDNYNFNFVSGILTVNKRAVSITADAKAITYGDDAPQLTAVVEGLADGDTFESLNVTLLSSYQKGMNAGAYTISLNTDNLSCNYRASYQSADITVSKKAVTLSADSNTVAYGNDAPNFTFTAEGLVLNQSIAVLGEISGLCAYDKNTAQAGEEYDITVDGAQSVNYEITYIKGILTVTKQSVTVTANGVSLVYGDELPALTSQVSGLVLGHSLESAGAVLSVGYQKGSDIGSYDISLDTENANTNYIFNYTAAQVQVSVLEVSAVWELQTRYVYNGSDQSADVKACYTDIYGQIQYLAVVFADAAVFKNAGSYSASVSLNDFNYALENTSVSITIEKADYSGITHSQLSGTYSPDTTLADYTLEQNYRWKNSAVVPTVPVTEYDALYNADSDNYNDFALTIGLVLEKADYIGITHAGFSGTYSPDTTLADYQLADSYFWNDESINPTVPVKTYSAFYNADSDNYNNFALAITIDLAKATAVLDNPVSEFDFDGAEKTYSATVVFNGQEIGGEYTILDNSGTEAGLKRTAANTYKIKLTLVSDNYKFAAETAGYLKIKGVLYDGTLYTIEDALFTAESGTIIVKNNTTDTTVAGITSFADTANNGCYNDAAYYTLRAGVTLLVPFDGSNNEAINEVSDGGGTITKAYSVLNVPTGITITVNGTLNVNGRRSHSNTMYMGHTYGEYGQMILADGAVVNVNNGGTLSSNGFVTGDGLINAYSGSTVYDVLAIKDFRGGSVSIKIFLVNSNGIHEDMFPFNQYSFYNIESKLKIYYGSNFNARYFIYTSKGSVNGEMKIVGQGALFELQTDSSYLHKVYKTETGRHIFDIYGNMKTNYAEVKATLVTTVTMSTEKLEFPLTGNLDITVKSGSKLTLNYGFKLLPGATLTVEQGAEMEISSNGKLYVYGETANDVAYAENWSYKQYGGSQSVGQTRAGKSSYTATDLALFTVNGKLTVKGKLGGIVRSTAENASLNLPNATLTGTTKESVNNANRKSLTEVTFTAMGKIGAGATTYSAFEKAAYISQNGVWIKQ